MTIDTQFPLILKHIQADPAQLELGLLNLALNARDAMPCGGRILIAARLEQAQGRSGLAPGEYVCLAISDEGEGMDEETLAKAIDPFFTTKDIGKGTGLGLSMVAGMVEQCGGKLILRSTKGVGTVRRRRHGRAQDAVGRSGRANLQVVVHAGWHGRRPVLRLHPIPRPRDGTLRTNGAPSRPCVDPFSPVRRSPRPPGSSGTRSRPPRGGGARQRASWRAPPSPA
ncbi:ATP-binding protein [Muricoccus aerilatus]|uniref:ATP-binding protein n=1 Tax=Muricoccus aerilatus TaxID=452982 RepID=UPI001B80807B|nr:ATP-binding protein [Roseomonas aerilata]